MHIYTGKHTLTSAKTWALTLLSVRVCDVTAAVAHPWGDVKIASRLGTVHL